MLSRYHKSRYIIPIILLLIMWRLLTLHLNAPWFGHHDANGVWLSAVSRNFRTYGVDELGPIPIMNRGPMPPGIPQRYVRHPPLVPWAVTTAHFFIGEHEMAARLVSIAGTMIGLTAFYVMCRRLYHQQQAILCTMLFAFTPMLIYFGRMPNHEPLSLAFLLAFLAVCVNWSRNPTRGRWWFMIILVVLAIWTAWASFFFVFFAGLFGFWTGRPALHRRMIPLIGLAGLALLSVIGFYQLIYPDALESLQRAFLWRTSTASELSDDFTPIEFAAQTAIHLLPHATIAVFILGLAGIIPTLRRAHGRDRGVLLALGLSGLVYIIIFRSASYVHDYYKIYLMPFLAISAANMITLALSKPSIRRFTQPALLGLFLASTGFAMIYLNSRYAASYAEDTLQFAQNIAENTSPNEVILLNIEQASPIIEYYAYRHIVWNVQPEAARRRTEAGEYPVVYAYCGSSSSEGLLPLADGSTVTEAGDCQFLRFNSE